MQGFIVVRAADRRLAWPMAQVVEIFRTVALSGEAPHRARGCLGVVNCRGRLIVAVDLAVRLGFVAARPIEALVGGCVIVTRHSGGEIGYVVDELLGLVEDAGEPVPDAELGQIVERMVPFSDGHVPALRVPLLLTVSLRRALRALGEGARP